MGTGSNAYKVTERYGYGWTDPRGLFGVAARPFADFLIQTVARTGDYADNIAFGRGGLIELAYEADDRMKELCR